jgi:hypothetical protein
MSPVSQPAGSAPTASARTPTAAKNAHMDGDGDGDGSIAVARPHAHTCSLDAQCGAAGTAAGGEQSQQMRANKIG